jgi:hypothetical protein
MSLCISDLKLSFILLLAVVFALAVVTGPATAQVYTGSLTGVATDPSGAIVPNAQAILTDEQKGFTYTAKTDAEGRYVLRNLPPGTYALAVTAEGMRGYQRSGITLTVSLNAEADVKLELQGMAEVVSVTGAAPLLATQDASTGQLVNQKFINDLPLVSRSVFNLAELAPGVTQAAGGTFGLNDSDVNFISNGGRNSTADIVMDGASQTNQENNGGVNTPLYCPAQPVFREPAGRGYAAGVRPGKCSARDLHGAGAWLEFRVEAFNALNHPQFAAPNLTVGSSAFGKITAQANSPRHVQLGLKLYF